MARRPRGVRRRLTPAEHRALYPKIRDGLFADVISVPEAAEIMGCADSYVRKLLRAGLLAGKAVTSHTYIVSLRDAKKSAVEYRERAAKGTRRGRPRSKA